MNRPVKKKRLRTRSALLWSLVLGATALAAARAQEDGGAVFVDTTTVSVVEVPVQVLAKGKPVRGLNAENFVLLDEGEPRALSSFEVVDVARAAEPLEATLAPAPSLAARRKFLFLFDLSFTRPRDVLLGEKAATAMVAKMAPTDLVAIACFSSRQGLQVVLNFTSDHERALEVLEGLAFLLGGEGRASRDDGTETAKRDPLRLSTAGWSASVAEVGRALAGEISAVASELEAAPTELLSWGSILRGNLMANMAVFGYQDNQNQQGSLLVRMTDSFADLARRTEGVPGQKHMVLFSSGFREDLLSDSMFHREWNAGSTGWILAAVDEGLGEMRRAGWLVHPVVPGGAAAWQIKRSGLFHFAAETGGTLFERYEDLTAAVGRLDDETAVTYMLSFQPEDLPAEPSYRRLEVKLVDGPRGAQVRHKDGYYAPASAPSEGVTGAQWRIGSILATGGELDELGVGVIAVPVELSAMEARVAVLLDVPGQGLLGAAGSSAQADLFVYAFDKEGRVRDFLATRVDLDPDRHGERLAGGLRFAGELRLRPGTYRLRFGVHVLASGRMAVVTRHVAIPADGEDEAVLYAPFFLLADDRDVLLWRSGDADASGAEPAFPFQLGRVRLNPTARLTLRDGGPVHLAVIGLGLAGQPLRARVVGADGGEVAVTLTAVGGLPAENGIPDLHLLKLETDGLPAGTYALELGLGDGGGQAGGSARAVFRIAS